MAINKEKNAKLIYGATLPEGQYYNTDLRWLVSILLPDPHFLLLLPGKRPPVLFASSLEYSRAIREAINCEVLSIEGFIFDHKARTFFEALGIFLKKSDIQFLILHPETPVSLQSKLQLAGLKTKIGPDPWFPQRIQKAQKEIVEISRATRLVEEVLLLIKKRLQKTLIKDGYVTERGRRLTSEVLRVWIEGELYSRGLHASGTIISSGEAAGRPHDYGLGPILAKMPIVFDIFPHIKTTGYYTDMTRTFFKGEPAKKMVQAYNSVLGAQRVGVAAIRANADSAKVHQSVAAFLKRRGFETDFIKGYGFIHSTGHGVGLRIHEDPRISERGEILKENSIVTVEPGLYYPDDGWGIRIEDLGVVTKKGLELLSSFPKKLKQVVL